jgi:hypothetical protein
MTARSTVSPITRLRAYLQVRLLLFQLALLLALASACSEATKQVVSPGPPSSTNCKDNWTAVTLTNQNVVCVDPRFANYIGCMQGIGVTEVTTDLSAQEGFDVGASVAVGGPSPAPSVKVGDQTQAAKKLTVKYSTGEINDAAKVQVKSCDDAFRAKMTLDTEREQQIIYLPPPDSR